MTKYVCKKCGFKTETDKWLWKCPACGGVLEIEGKVESPKITLGEGNTPLVNLFGFGGDVYFKLEYLNPTGSFKDRGSAMALSQAQKLGIGCIVEDSSGNAGISVAAYAAAAGIWATVVVPKGCAPGKRHLIEALGAEIVEAEDREAAGNRAREMETQGCAYIGHQWNPWFIKGMETIASEINEQLGKAPDAVITPVSSGTLLLGLYNGFRKSKKLPRLYAVQASGYSPLYDAINGKHEGKPSKLADALQVLNPPRLEQMKEAILKSGGDALVVNDEEILSALAKLLKAGTIVEPSSASALAGYMQLLNAGKIKSGEKVVIILTGSGLKYPEMVSLISS
ncbi:MAG: threonine synthase [Nitrososphaeria archaeon]|nr:pyridoxal-phosphate dependent enzyme [Conexivisphaerales archaeon]